MKLSLIFSVLIFVASCTDFDPIGTDVSSRFKAHFDAKERLSGSERQSLQKYTILTVNGFLSISQIVNHNTLAKADKTFDQMRRWLGKSNTKFRKLAVNPRGDVENNGKLIASQIKNIPGPIILVTHSKGGLDTLEALLRYPEIQNKVKGWLAFQAPFYGSPIADYVNLMPSSSVIIKMLIKFFRGQPEAVMAMSTETRFNYIDDHEDEIEDLLKKIHVLSIGTWIAKQPVGSPDTSLSFTRNLMENFGQQSDGLVPWQSAILPGSSYVTIEGMDHFNTVRSSKNLPNDRIQLYNSLYSLLLEQL